MSYPERAPQLQEVPTVERQPLIGVTPEAERVAATLNAAAAEALGAGDADSGRQKWEDFMAQRAA